MLLLTAWVVKFLPQIGYGLSRVNILNEITDCFLVAYPQCVFVNAGKKTEDPSPGSNLGSGDDLKLR